MFDRDHGRPHTQHSRRAYSTRTGGCTGALGAATSTHSRADVGPNLGRRAPPPTAMRTLTIPSLRSVLATALLTLAALLAARRLRRHRPRPARRPPPARRAPRPTSRPSSSRPSRTSRPCSTWAPTPPARRAAAPDWPRPGSTALDGVQPSPSPAPPARPDGPRHHALHRRLRRHQHQGLPRSPPSYREPQGVGVWTARLQHAREVDPDGDPATANLDAVESVTLTFLTGRRPRRLPDRPSRPAPTATSPARPPTPRPPSPSPPSTSGAWPRSTAPPRARAVVTYANAGAARDRHRPRPRRHPRRQRHRDRPRRRRRRRRPHALLRGRFRRRRRRDGDRHAPPDADLARLGRRRLARQPDATTPTDSFMQTRQRGGDGVVVREVTEG